ncbi:ATP-binding protein [Tunicatimonas pelagia]|uniref:ATP-binding protein n=1 Tax=Tunicatimonas pelagia TaxID=931531 RepID=UPI0026657500|nr:ATP-binding protein [Tunicatimonas pelagia]WKN42201.1 ATP-binding protein [Tunicatimonas pelagia]WKN45319.1 ATP-binding protein [Tunicatimonas pelagia]
MTNLVEKHDIQKKLVVYQQETGLSYGHIAQQVGCSTAIISNVANGKFDNISPAMLQKVNQVVTSQKESFHVLTTNNFNDIFKTCQQAKSHQFMIGLIGDTGLGKTLALKEFSRRKQVYYIEYCPTMTPKNFFEELLKAMGVAFIGSKHEMLNRIAEELNAVRNTLLIIDEVGQMSQAMFQYLHTLRNKTMFNAGMVLSGMPYFEEYLKKLVRQQKQGASEFFRRINLWQYLKVPTKKEKRNMCMAYGIHDESVIGEMNKYRDFGSLYNGILFHQLLNAPLKEKEIATL